MLTYSRVWRIIRRRTWAWSRRSELLRRWYCHWNSGDAAVTSTQEVPLRIKASEVHMGRVHKNVQPTSPTSKSSQDAYEWANFFVPSRRMWKSLFWGQTFASTHQRFTHAWTQTQLWMGRMWKEFPDRHSTSETYRYTWRTRQISMSRLCTVRQNLSKTSNSSTTYPIRSSPIDTISV